MREGYPSWCAWRSRPPSRCSKRTNEKWYWAILRQVAKGKKSFIELWNKAPGWLKGIFAGFTADEVFETALWLLGIG